MYQNKKKVGVLLLTLIVLIAVFSFAITAGAFKLTVFQVYEVLGQVTGILNTESDTLARMIVWDIRLPRIIMATITGFALATAGSVFQACFRNPLVEPYILGVSGGAAFGAALAIAIPTWFFSAQLSAFFFGTLAVMLAYHLARVKGQTSVVSLILAGVIIGALFTAMVSVLKYLSDDAALREIMFWIMGGFYHSSWDEIHVSVPMVMISFLIIWAMGWKLNVLSMGDAEARALGVQPQLYKVILISLATLITALTVASTGIIAWVGLMMPHAARMILGPDNRYVIPLSAMLGALYLIICDTLARTLTSAEIPVGIITAIAGAPYLLYLLRTKGTRIEMQQ
ncbi:MAG: iron ABC transporter permease [Cyclobacteriaceae bacterium]|nr:iron ABC transporter permease [Cyclobacteriaceae bacterium]